MAALSGRARRRAATAVIAAVRTPVIQRASRIASGMPVAASLSSTVPAMWGRPLAWASATPTHLTPP
jgi:hypothetical protein